MFNNLILAKSIFSEFNPMAFVDNLRYMLSGMPECTCFGMLIVFFGYAYAYMKEEKTGQLVAMFVIAAVLTLMRPYMIVFLLLPMLLLVFRKKWCGVGISIGVVAVTGIIYILIKKFLSAEYFTPLFDTTWITTFLREGFVEGFRYMWDKLHFMGWDFIGKSMQGLREGLAMEGILGSHNALAVRGALLHMVNHSLIKLVLFMVAGVVYMNLHELDLNKVRGFGKNKPLLLFIFSL